jgi:hypothetical protein
LEVTAAFYIPIISGLSITILFGISSLSIGIFLLTALIILLLLAILTKSDLYKTVILVFPVLFSVLLIGISVYSSEHYGLKKHPVSTHANQSPNLILIVMDTVRANRLASFGYQKTTMPKLEQWAKTAIVFKKAISPAGWTSPAHASMFSGKTVSKHGIHYANFQDLFKTPAFPDIDWLPRILSDKGYFTLALSANPLALPDNDIGFQAVQLPAHKSFKFTIGGTMDRIFSLFPVFSESLRWRLPYVDSKNISRIAQKNLNQLSAPFFLFINYLDAHSPFNPPKTVLKAMNPGIKRVFSSYLEHQDLTKKWQMLPKNKSDYLNALYDGELQWLDTHLNQLLEFLHSQFSKNTVIIIVSDHGEELGENGRVGHEYGLSQDLIHVPLFIKYPGCVAQTIENETSLIYLFDYMLGAANNQYQDISMLTSPKESMIISERYPSSSNMRILGAEYGRPWLSAIQNHLKIVGPGNYPQNYFQLDQQSYQEIPISEPSSLPALQLKDQMDIYWQTTQDRRKTFQNKGTEKDPETIKKLKALGYM